MNNLQKQSAYWDRASKAFDSIYTHNKNHFLNLLDKIFRKDMLERFYFTIGNCEPIKGKTFLDIGCGNGIYSIELAKKGAKNITGLDISPKMIELSRKRAADAGVSDICNFILTDLLNQMVSEYYDIGIAVGLFDYIKEPLPILKKMNEIVSNKIILSFPRIWTWRAPVRKIRLLLNGCYVRFYRKSKIQQLLYVAGFNQIEIYKIGKLFCVFGYKNLLK